MARASTPTLLSLDRWAKIMGIPPAHFNGGYVPNTNPAVWPIGGCSSVWPQHAWQNSDQISREDVARAIHEAERDIAAVLGYFPAPVWVAEEVHRWPRHHRRDAWNASGLNVRGQPIAVRARWGKVAGGGRRAVAEVETGATVAYSDPDGDGFDELATVTAATDLTDECEIKIYFAGKSGSPAWEIRPVRSKSIAGGSVTITLDSWLLVDPDLWEAYPTGDGFEAVDLGDGDNLVATVDLYREYTDTARAGAQFLWEPEPRNLPALLGCASCGGTGCAACALITQDGCLAVRDAEAGIVVPAAATYADGQWTRATWSECREPDQVKLWYRAGEFSDEYLRGETCDPLGNWWAQTIAHLATARLERPFCSCGNAEALAAGLREDLAKSTGERSYTLSLEDLDNPFGTRRGEIAAWRRVSRLATNLVTGGAI